MSYAFEVPGYMQGYRFSDESEEYYDAASKTFHDQAGYGAKSGLSIHTGSTVFDTLDSHRGVKLDNTFHGSFQMPIPWQGSVVAVMRPELLTSGTHNSYPLIFGDASSISSNGKLHLSHFSGRRRLAWGTPSGGLSAVDDRTDDLMRVFSASLDQLTRKSYVTNDGSTVTEATATASTTTGNAVAVESAITGARFGELKGISGNVTLETDLVVRMYEMHFFASNIWTNHATKAAAFMTSLREKYGVS